jgi:hypothetical protein
MEKITPGKGRPVMYPKWLNRLVDFFEELVLWLAEGKQSPFGPKDPQRAVMNPKRYRD